MDSDNSGDLFSLVAEDAEVLLDMLIDNLRIQIELRTPVKVETLTDEIMDHLGAMPIVRQDPQWIALMAALLAAQAVQRLAYREEGLTPTADQTRVLIAIAEATGVTGVGCFSIRELAEELDLTCDEVHRHTRALVRLGMLEQM